LRLLTAVPFAAVAVLFCSASAFKSETLTEPKEKLDKTGSVLVATPTDAIYGAKRYPGSGATTAAAILSAFARYNDSTEVSPDCRDLACLQGGAKPYRYYVVPQILRWEDRATEWSGKRDKLEIKLTVFSADGHVLASSIISSKSKLMTFGGDHPQDLLQKPLAGFAESLY
jgi:hypothetical protein